MMRRKRMGYAKTAHSLKVEWREPRYVDIAVARWEQYTGEKATRE